MSWNRNDLIDLNSKAGKIFFGLIQIIREYGNYACIAASRCWLKTIIELCASCAIGAASV